MTRETNQLYISLWMDSSADLDIKYTVNFLHGFDDYVKVFVFIQK